MKTEQITVSGTGAGIDEALALTERVGSDAGLGKKPQLHLRLLAEELFGIIRGIAGEVVAEYWIESEGSRFELHLKSDVKLTEEMRDHFLAASSSGKNSAAVSFMGKIRVMIADLLISAKETLPYAMMNTVAAYPTGGTAGEVSSVWSLSIYRDEVRSRVGESEEASEAWDELEKSIVANIADDIKVSIVGKKVEMILVKEF
ncbi:MAG: hypothetical protein ILO42_01130 [Clostridia bacterium]|nr:hypothetical protein [Clostridia bacterium]